MDPAVARTALAETESGGLAVAGDGEILAAADRSRVVVGLAPEELTGRTVEGLVEDGLADGTVLEGFETALAELRRGAPSYTFRTEFRPSNSGPWRSYAVEVLAHHEVGELAGTVWAVSALGSETRLDEAVETLQVATRDVLAADSVEAGLAETGRAANRTLGFPGTGVRRYDPDEEVLRFVGFGASVGDIDTRPPFPVEDTPHGRAFRTGETVLTDVPPPADDDLDREPFSHAMYLPVGEYGTLSLARIAGPFEPDDVRFAELLADNAAAALAQAERRERLRRRADRLASTADAVAAAAEGLGGVSGVPLAEAAEAADGDARVEAPDGAAVSADRDVLVALLESLFGAVDDPAVLALTDDGFTVEAAGADGEPPSGVPRAARAAATAHGWGVRVAADGRFLVATR